MKRTLTKVLCTVLLKEYNPSFVRICTIDSIAQVRNTAYFCWLYISVHIVYAILFHEVINYHIYFVVFPWNSRTIKLSFDICLEFGKYNNISIDSNYLMKYNHKHTYNCWRKIVCHQYGYTPSALIKSNDTNVLFLSSKLFNFCKVLRGVLAHTY